MKPTRILDGGMSRELVRLGAELRQPEWSALALIENPAIVRRVHEEFFAAGADIITTNSYALVPFHIGEERFRLEGRRLMSLAGRLAREAADEAVDRKVLVAGSLPPIFGSYEPQRFMPDLAHEYLDALVEELSPSVDVWLGETLSLVAKPRRCGMRWRAPASHSGYPSRWTTSRVPSTGRQRCVPAKA